MPYAPVVFSALALFGASSAANAGEVFRADMDANQAVEMFVHEFGKDLTVEFDFAAGTPREIYGRAMDLGWQPATDAEFESAARSLLDFYAAMFGFDSRAVAPGIVHRIRLDHIGTSNKIAVDFRSEVEGVPVESANVQFLFLESGKLIGISNSGIPMVQNIDLVPTLNDQQALAIAEEAFGRDVASVLSLDIAIVRNESGNAGTLAYNVELLATETDQGVPIQRMYSIDAHRGDVVRSRSTVHTATDVIGNVQGWVSPGTNPDQGANEVKEPLNFAHADGSVGSDDTDAAGNFTIAYSGSQNQSITVDFDNDSRFAYVISDTSGELSQTKTLTPGVSGTYNFNVKKLEKKTAQLNAHKHIVVMTQWIKSVNPNDNTLNRQFRAYVNIDSCCNAFYNGSSINHYIAGCGCVNTAYSTVVYHELGHWANDLYSSGNGPDGFGEGNADNFATHISDDPIVGKNFCGNGCHVRDARNNRQYCNNACGQGCYGGVHADGEVLMGAMWKVRTRLGTSLGDAAGDLVSNTLFVAWMNAYNDSAICENVRTHYLVLDDNDGNINNGTPHSGDIDNGFKDQGFPGYY